MAWVGSSLASQNILKEGRRSLGDITDAEVAKPEKRLGLSVINGH